MKLLNSPTRLLLILAALVALAAIFAAGCGGDDEDDGPRSANPLALTPTTSWPVNGGSYYNDRYSGADQIDKSNVKNLKGEWLTRLGSGVSAKYSGEAEPLVKDGVMYVVTGADDVFALDVKTGDKKWTYEANLDQKITTVCCGWTSRGVAQGDGHIFVGQLDGTLVALDEKTGKKVWQERVGKWQEGYTITSAPVFYDGKVITGVSGGEYGIRGSVTAYDAKTGKRAWRFYTIPKPGEPNSDSWPAGSDAWEHGGVPVWQTPAIDPELNMIYFSTGNTSPDFDGSSREGDNLYANSIVALDVNTGKYKWHFQQVHHDIWDYDSPSPVVLFNKTIDGKERKGLGEAGKTGWVYLLDRTNGKPLIGIEEKPVPQNAKNKTAATQPFPVGDSFIPQSIPKSEEPEGFENPVNGGKIFTPFWKKPIVAKPGTLGGANWPPSSYNPETGYIYVCGSDQASVYKASVAEYDANEIKKGDSFLGSAFTSPKNATPKGTFTAIDVETNKIVWQKKFNTTCYSGSTTTAGGLVFFGRNNGELVAFDAENGDELWKFQTGAGANATASIFEDDGKQYVAFYAAGNTLAGTKHGDNVWLFSLDGKLGPEAKTARKDRTNQPNNGEEIFATNCSGCHGLNGEGGHNGPKLTGINLDEAAIEKQIEVGGGAMPPFKNTLTEEEIKTLAKYVYDEYASK